MYYPLNYDQITWMSGHYSPQSVKSFNNATFSYWERSLYQRALSVIKWHLPENWQGSTKDFFDWCLARFGFVMISQNDEYGYFFQPVNVSGTWDLYYQPTEAVLANPLLSKTYKIHEECELLKLTPDYRGIWDVITYYAEKLSTLDVAIQTNAINSKLAFILGAKNRNAAEALKTIMDRVNRGEPAVFYDKTIQQSKPNDPETPFQFLPVQDLGKNYILDQLLREFQTILNAFDAEIGIKTVPYQKMERMVTGEAESKEQDAQARVKTWLESLTSSLEMVKKLYPDLDLSFELRSDAEGKEAQQDGMGEDDPDRDPELSSGRR